MEKRKKRAMDIKRKKFQGVINILSFNRHFYISGFIVWGLTAIYSNLFGLSTLYFWVINGAIIYGLIMPLIVSAYVYDFSGYYDFDWLNKIGLTETVFGVYGDQGYTWRYVPNERIPSLKLEKVINKDLHFDSEAEKAAKFQALIDLNQNSNISENNSLIKENSKKINEMTKTKK